MAGTPHWSDLAALLISRSPPAAEAAVCTWGAATAPHGICTVGAGAAAESGGLKHLYNV